MATKVSRSTHTVRVTSMDKRFYADVEVLDAISLTLSNGFQICYKISQPKIVEPLIIDNTGDGNGKAGPVKTYGTDAHQLQSAYNGDIKLWLASVKGTHELHAGHHDNLAAQLLAFRGKEL